MRFHFQRIKNLLYFYIFPISNISTTRSRKIINLCTQVTYQYQLPKYIPIQRQSELAKAPKWPVSQKQLPSSLPANANLPIFLLSTSYGLNLPYGKVESLAFYSPAATPDLISIRSLITTSPAVRSSSCAHNSAMFFALCDTTVTCAST